MTDPYRCEADRAAAEKKRERKAEFMRAYVIALARAGAKVTIETDAPLVAQRARWVWDAIEAEAAK